MIAKLALLVCLIGFSCGFTIQNDKALIQIDDKFLPSINELGILTR